MRIVQINTFSYKATGNIMLNIHCLLKEYGYDSYVVWGRGRKSEHNNEIYMNDAVGTRIHGIYTRITDKTGFASKNATRNLLKKLNQIEPDIIHLHNIHGYYINVPLLFDYVKDNRIRLVWTLHDCWPFTGHCAYYDMCNCLKWKEGCFDCEQKNSYPKSIVFDNSEWNWQEKRRLFNGLQMTIVTPSEWLKQQVRESFLKDYPCVTIYNGIDLNKYFPSSNYERIIQKYRLSIDKPIVLGVASEWTERKGLKDFVSLSELMGDTVQIVIVGLTSKQSHKMPPGIVSIQRTENIEELRGLYSIATIFFNPTYSDIFGMVNIEALACGTPVLTYDSGGSPETILSPRIGRVIKKTSRSNTDINDVKIAIEDMIRSLYTDATANEEHSKDGLDSFCFNNKEKISCMCREASEFFDMKLRLKEYVGLYERIVKN